MTTTAPVRQLPVAPRPRRRRRWPHRVAIGLLLLIVLPVVLLAGAGNPPCTATPAATPATSTPAGGMFAQPLTLLPGRWYTVGATQYGGPSDPGSSVFGSSGVYLPSLPDSFAELSLLDTNPANGGTFTFADANALNTLPYGTAIRVRNGPAQRVLVKRDVGYGQGPGQTIPYRIDVWWQAATQLGITKTPVQIQLAPASGTAGVLGQLPGATGTPASSASTGAGCAGAGAGALGPLPLTPGQTATINPQTGIASAPVSTPAQVKLAIAAGNEIINKPYPVPDVHYGPLSTLWPAYDCSGTVSFVLYKLGLLQTAEVSGQLESFGDPGPGRWITIYATAGHTWIDIAGIALDTSASGNPPSWQPPGSGPRWRPNPTGNLADGLSYVVRHPNGL